MTLKEYLDNPSGKGDSSMNRAVVTSVLNEKYEKLIKNKNIKVRVYKTLGLNTEYFVHLVIPSETERENTYDVVFHFFNPDKLDVGKSLKKYDVKFFSNAPSFAYTFLHVYHKNELFEESLANKFDKMFFTDSPEKRNRFGIVNYEKYLYFGAKYINDSLMISSKAAMDLRAVNYMAPMFNNKIRNFDTIMNQYKRAKNKLKRSEHPSPNELSDNADRDVSSNGKVKVKTPKPPKKKEIKSKKPTKPKVKKISKK